MRRIRIYFRRQFIKAAVPVTAMCLLTAALSLDPRMTAGVWVLLIEVIGCLCFHRQNRILRRYSSMNDDIRFFSRRSLVVAVICAVGIAAVIILLKVCLNITFVARGILLGIPFIILVCQKLICDSLLEMAVDEITGASEKTKTNIQL